MEIIKTKRNVFKNIKCILCTKISVIFLNIYMRFRNCSDYAKEAKRKINKYEKDSHDIEVVKQVLPKVKDGIYELKQRNNELEEALQSVVNDLNDINYYSLKNNVNSIKMVLKKYNFNKNI